jgi:hypothetical protein
VAEINIQRLIKECQRLKKEMEPKQKKAKTAKEQEIEKKVDFIIDYVDRYRNDYD